jgi:hypothetical protein
MYFIYLINQYWIFWDMLHNISFLSTKCSVFHNVIFFCS